MRASLISALLGFGTRNFFSLFFLSAEIAEASSPSNDEDEVIARICELTHRLGYNQAKTKMLLGQWGRYLVSLERSLQASWKTYTTGFQIL